MADRFYCPDPAIDGQITLGGDEARHLATVLRAGPGRVVEVFDGRGTAHQAVVVAIDKRRIILRIEHPLPRRELPCRLTLGVAPPKGDRLDWLVEKATELGVSTLVPLRTARAVVDPRASKLDRLRRAVVEASKQSRRDTLMVIAEPTGWDEWLASVEAPGLVAHPGGPPPADWPDRSADGGIALAIGPEGGFTEDEVDRARGLGWTAVGLGSTTLRVETAALAGASLLMGLATKQQH